MYTLIKILCCDKYEGTVCADRFPYRADERYPQPTNDDRDRTDEPGQGIQSDGRKLPRYNALVLLREVEFTRIDVKTLSFFLGYAAVLLIFIVPACAQSSAGDVCPRADVGSVAQAPEDLRSQNGVLRVNLSFRSFKDPSGLLRYCYLSAQGSQAPTLRLNPGDLLILNFKNQLPASQNRAHMHEKSLPDSCASGPMTPSVTNLHFHGLTIPPVCHQDDTLRTLIEPSDTPFEYRFRIPVNEPPGLYWYHPHPHGFSEAQVLGGASGALIVEGIERANKLVAGLPERVLIVRDQRVADASTDPNKPGKDLSVNYVPVLYPSYTPAVIRMRPSRREFWRVVNACADTYLDLKVLFNGKPQFIGLVALDGVPLGYEDGSARDHVIWESHQFLSPGGRAEFVFSAPAEGVQAQWVTQTVVTGPVTNNSSPKLGSAKESTAGLENPAQEADDDYAPPRPLVRIAVSPDAPDTASSLPISPVPLGTPVLTALASAEPVRQRKLYFSERLQNPNDPKSPTIFYLTEEGKSPAAFDPSSTIPNIVVHQGDVEDWLIENRSPETHAFHIHQTHFMVLARQGVPVEEPYLRDTINVPFWDGFTPEYPSIKLRMDFRDPGIVGVFPYHCHILQHEDGGMMGTIRVESSPQTPSKKRKSPDSGKN